MGAAIEGLWRVDGSVTGQTAMRGMHGWLHLDDGCDLQHTGIISAIGAEITSSHGAEMTAGNICLLHLACSSTEVDLTDAGEMCAFIFVDNDAGHAKGGMDSVMHINAWDTPYFLKMSVNNNPGIMDMTQTMGSDCVGHIKVRWNNADAYINVVSDTS